MARQGYPAGVRRVLGLVATDRRALEKPHANVPSACSSCSSTSRRQNRMPRCICSAERGSVTFAWGIAAVCNGFGC